MAGPTLSYVHGASDQPLIGKTIGEFFDEACAKWAARPALVVRHQKVRLSYGELRAAADKLAAGLLTLGLNPGDRIGIWSPNNSEWVLTQFATAKAGLILVNINPSYRVAELEYALTKVGCKALILAEKFKTSDYVGMLRELAPELGHSHWRQLASGNVPLLRNHGARRRRGSQAHRGALPPVAVRRADQHPVYIRHYRLSEGRDAFAPQHSQQRVLYRRSDAADAGGPAVYPRAALSLLRHGARQSRGAHPWRLHGVPRRRFRSARHTANSRRGALHRAPWCADDVHRAARSPGLRKIRSFIIADRNHGWLAMPDRGDEACRRQNASFRNHHRLRHDRNKPGQLSELDRGSAGAPGIDCRAHSAAYRSQDRGSQRPDRADRHAGRAPDPRLLRDARLLGRCRAHPRSDRRGALDAYRRFGDDRRGGLLQHRRPHQGHGHPRRRERLSARDRRISLSPSEDSRCPGHRRPGRSLWRGDLRLGQAAPRRGRE